MKINAGTIALLRAKAIRGGILTIHADTLLQLIAEIERLRAIVLEQKELWKLAKRDLNALMELYDPIGKCEAAEAGRRTENERSEVTK